jgi:GH24 family phage-related lysozyme (muramidase)
MSNPAQVSLEQLFQHWQGLPHQVAAIKMLQEDIIANGYAAAMRRDRPWYAIWSQQGQPQDPVVLTKPLVQSFEGCRLTAYPDPGTGGEPFTIGWGNTTYASGKPVRPGDTITQQMADELLDVRLRTDLLRLAKRIPRWDTFTVHQQAALLSFTFNCGPNWFGGEGYDTITARVRDGQLDQVPAAMALYINPGSKVEAGLRRRREAEGRLWRGEGLPAAAPVAPPRKVPPHLLLTRTRKLNAAGLELLQLARVVDGITMDKLLVTSGVASKQRFETGARSSPGQLTPLPEGRWRIGPVEWAGGKGNWSVSWPDPGLGPVWIALEYEAPGRTARSAIGIHLDANIATAPGSAGCVVLSNRGELEAVIRWLEAGSIKHLFVDWGLKTCPKP